ncbi:MAG TPA: hypothetical protein VHJ20_23285 [Polyangia bacterium]|nr:hypothetical protein [Polyangia bacterium]
MTFACLLSGAAHADAVTPNCDDATMFPNPIYLTGSSAYEQTAANMAVELATLTGNDKVTLIYKTSTSCDGANAIRDNVTLTGTADTFTPNATNAKLGVINKGACSLDHSVTKADVGVSDVWYDNCTGGGLTATMTDVKGPVQAMIFIVPHANMTNTDLTYYEAQDIWGCGMKGMVSPFTSEVAIQQRNKDSGTQITVAKNIGVPAASFKGVMNSAGGDLVNSLNAADPNTAIGFLAADSFDSKRGQLNALAFQGLNQTKAYYADSASGTFDKKNVRDGHYLVWGPEHFLATIDATSKAITNTKAANFIGWATGTLTTAAFNYVEVDAISNIIPQCAMKVQRDTDGGLLRPYTPATGTACGCKYESIVTKTAVPAGCTMCTSNADCGTKTCSNGFCE